MHTQETAEQATEWADPAEHERSVGPRRDTAGGGRPGPTEQANQAEDAAVAGRGTRRDGPGRG